MFLGVGTGFPIYRRNSASAWRGHLAGRLVSGQQGNAGLQREARGDVQARPRPLGSQVGYASLQMLEQAIERVGKIDRPAIIRELQTGTFDTVLGKIKLENNMPKDAFWLIGQWQNGFFTGVSPQRAGASPLVIRSRRGSRSPVFRAAGASGPAARSRRQPATAIAEGPTQPGLQTAE